MSKEYIENILEEDDNPEAYFFFVMDVEKYLEYDDADLYE